MTMSVSFGQEQWNI